MTLFHVFAIILYCLFVAAISKLFALEAYAVGLVTAIVLLIVGAVFSVYQQRKDTPKCRKCKSRRHYRITGWAKDMGIADEGLVFECKKCGERYLQTPTAFTVLEGNKPGKYMKRLSISKRWGRDV